MSNAYWQGQDDEPVLPALSEPSDPFRTAGIRERVLTAWTASPARFREDANAEEDLVHGGYRDRVVVELAQNASDAAIRAGIVGRLEFALADGLLSVRNTGATLDAAGVQALCTLRASAKRGASTVGRFGVGFAAVLALTDRPRIAGAAGGVCWSAERTRALVSGVPALRPELDRRDGAVPVLRLPFCAAATAPAGWDTEVVLPLRDEAAEELAGRLLAEVGPALVLVLPGLAEIAVGGRVVGTPHWPVVRAHGRLPAHLLAERGVEERERDSWSVLVARPNADGAPGVVYAPTPTDDALSLPVLLAVTFPLDASRRRVAPGALTDFLVERAATAYGELLCALDPMPTLLELVPVGFAVGEIDAALRAALLTALPGTPFLPTAGGAQVRPADAVVLDLGLASDAAVPLLADALPGLLPAGWPARSSALAALGVRRLAEAGLVDAVAGLGRPPAWWRSLYAALAAASDRDALGALPVPLAPDGRLVTGARGLVLATEVDVADADLSALGLRVVHPDAVHPLLERLGAVRTNPRALLADARVRAAVEASYDEEDPTPIATAVLSLVALAGPAPEELPWLAELALPGADGEVYPAGELLLPGSPLAAVVAPDAPFGVVAPELVERYGAQVLHAVGVLSSFAVLRADDVLDAEHDLEAEAEYLNEVCPSGGAVEQLIAVRDLELVADWTSALPILATAPLRAAVLAETTVVRVDGTRTSAPSYTTWWLRRHRVLAGRYPDQWRVARADPVVAGLYEPAPGAFDEAFLSAVGVRRSLTDALDDPDQVLDLLDRVGESELGRPLVRSAYAVLLAALHGVDVDPPSRVRAVRVGELVNVPPGEAVVIDAPDQLAVVGERPRLPVPASLAREAVRLLGVRLLGVRPLATRQLEAPTSAGRARAGRWADVPGIELALARLGKAAAPGTGVLVAPGPWRVLDRADQVDGSPEQLGRALAWRTGHWPRRAAVVEALRAGAGAGPPPRGGGLDLDWLAAEDEVEDIAGGAGAPG